MASQVRLFLTVRNWVISYRIELMTSFKAMKIKDYWGHETLFEQKRMYLCHRNMLKATINLKIHKNIFLYSFTLGQFTRKDPVHTNTIN